MVEVNGMVFDENFASLLGNVWCLLSLDVLNCSQK